jgi:putative phage-type endonuclease
MGATDIVEVCGLAPWQDAGPWRVWNAKTGATKPEDPTDEMRWGHHVEDYLRAWYSQTYGRRVEKTGPVFSRKYPWLWASPDGCSAPWDYYEIKNVGSFMASHWDLSDDDGIPHYVRAQVTVGMFCAEVDHWTVIATVGGLPPRVWTVQYDAELADLMVTRAAMFWRTVVDRIPPRIDASDACRAYLQSKWPRDERPLIESTMSDDETASERAEIAAAVKNGKARIKYLDSHLMSRIGDARGILGDGWKMTWKVGKDGKRRSRFTWRGEEDE